MTSLGVAGYMGSGKSSFVRILAQDDRTVWDGDFEAKALMVSDPAVREGIRREFGKEVFPDEKLSFRSLGEKAFASEEALKRLNAVVHPPLLKRLKTRLLQRSYKELVIVDAALIPLWEIEHWFDHCVWVHAPREERISRIIRKSGLPESVVTQRAKLQEAVVPAPSDKKWIAVENTGSWEDLQAAVGRFAERHLPRN
jgi:dephospho-CoA kinase